MLLSKITPLLTYCCCCCVRRAWGARWRRAWPASRWRSPRSVRRTRWTAPRRTGCCSSRARWRASRSSRSPVSASGTSPSSNSQTRLTSSFLVRWEGLSSSRSLYTCWVKRSLYLSVILYNCFTLQSEWWFSNHRQIPSYSLSCFVVTGMLVMITL